MSKFSLISRKISILHQYNVPNFKVIHGTVPGSPGSGAGRGGGAGGSVRESGGGLGRYGTAKEEGYFYNQQRDQLRKMQKELKNQPKKEKDLKLGQRTDNPPGTEEK